MSGGYRPVIGSVHSMNGDRAAAIGDWRQHVDRSVCGAVRPDRRAYQRLDHGPRTEWHCPVMLVSSVQFRSSNTNEVSFVCVFMCVDALGSQAAVKKQS